MLTLRAIDVLRAWTIKVRVNEENRGMGVSEDVFRFTGQMSESVRIRKT